MKKALKRAFTREGSALNSESDKPREERSEFGLDEHEDLKKHNRERGGEKKGLEMVRNEEEVGKMNTGERERRTNGGR